jgi:1-acyl-sn-glycerol-3-phosphate acyltransferase
MSWKYEPAHDLGMAPAERWKSLRREPGLSEVIVCHAWWAATRGWLRLRQRLRIEGRERLPAEPPFVLVANHTSHLDALVLGAAVPARLRPRVFPIAAGDTFFETPAAAALSATLLNALPMWRKKCGPHAMEELRARLVGEPCGYVIFPEGTRSRDGLLQRFRPGVGMLVAATPVTVVPCRIEGAFEAWPPTARRPRGGRVRVLVGDPQRFDDVANDRAGWEQVASRLHAAVGALGESPTSIGGGRS